MTRAFVGRQDRVRYLPDSRIEENAEGLLEEWRTKGWSRAVPVPLDDLVEIHLELIYIIEDLGSPDVLGLILFGDRTIKINSTLDPKIRPAMLGRFNFTLAHEIGHWRLHREQFQNGAETAKLFEKGSDPAFVCRSGSAEREEWQANRFASALLMPREELLAAWRDHRGSDEQLGYADLGLPRTAAEPITNAAIEKYALPMAVRFAVSAEAMRIRLRTLELVVPEVEQKLF